MTKKRKQIVLGQCNICGEQGKLSYEHVPNKEAYNKARVIEYSWEDRFVKKEDSKGKIVQGGIGEYTLCERCNNNTGHWYGNEYTQWAMTCFDFLKNRLPRSNDPDEAIITLHNVYPLRFLKQVVVCFFSIVPNLTNTYPDLKRFVLEKETRLLPNDCRFFINFYFGVKPKLKRWPLAAKISVNIEGNQIIPINKSILSEMAHPPFVLVMSDSTGFAHAGEITFFTNYDYAQLVEKLTLRLQVIRGESILPGSFQ